MVARVKLGDQQGAKELLNQLLGNVLWTPQTDLVEIKARVAELFIVVSRAVVEGGGPERSVLTFNTECLYKIVNMPNNSELYAWIGPAIDRLLGFLRIVPANADFAIVKRACDFLMEEFRSQLCLADVAREVHVSPHHLCRLFRRQLSVSVMDYLTEIRIEHAKRLLEKTVFPVKEVGKRVGFLNSSHFCKVFRRRTGLSAYHYRQEFRREGK